VLFKNAKPADQSICSERCVQNARRVL